MSILFATRTQLCRITEEVEEVWKSIEKIVKSGKNLIEVIAELSVLLRRYIVLQFIQ